MLTDVQIINLGLSGIAASRIKRIDPAVTPLEQYMAANYPQWKRQELAKRRWVFAMEHHYELTTNIKLEGVEKPYKFVLPIDCLRPVRVKHTEWEQRGRYLYSGYDRLFIDYIRNAPESDFDPLFNDVLARRIGWGSAEYVTQSSTKTAQAKEDYKDAVIEAGRNNAFIIGPEDIDDEDEDSWIWGRHNG